MAVSEKQRKRVIYQQVRAEVLELAESKSWTSAQRQVSGAAVRYDVYGTLTLPAMELLQRTDEARTVFDQVLNVFARVCLEQRQLLEGLRLPGMNATGYWTHVEHLRRSIHNCA